MSKAYPCCFQVTPTFCCYAFFSIYGGRHAEKHLLKKVFFNFSISACQPPFMLKNADQFIFSTKLCLEMPQKPLKMST
jgi:hypothetical protein